MTELQTALQSAARRAVEPVLTSFKVPGIALAFARGGDQVDHLIIGTDAAENPLAPDSLFPIASITKLATALAVLRLVDANSLDLDEDLGRYLPDAAAARQGVTLRRLLSHTGGLPQDLAPASAPYSGGLSWRALAKACLDTPLERQPHTYVQYSNVGYGLLAIVVERQTNLNFTDALESLALKPLGMEGYLGVEPPHSPIALADVRSAHVSTPLEPYNSPFWRALAVPWGGLITTVDGALRLVRAFHGFPEGFLSQVVRAEAVRNQTDPLGGGYGGPFTYPRCPWGLGPDLRGAKQPHWAPVEASPDTFGHAGASGCVTWCDPRADIAWAILGTRTADNGWLVRGSPSIGRAILGVLSQAVER